MTRSTMLALALLLLFAGACATTAPGRKAQSTRVELTTDHARYAPGDTVYVTLRNGGARDVGYNLCERVIQLHAKDGWVDGEEFPPPGGMCTRELRILAPGKSVRVIWVTRIPTMSGVYRITYRGGPPEARTTNEFVIEPR